MIQYDRRHHFNYQQRVLPERLDLYEEHLVSYCEIFPFLFFQRNFPEISFDLDVCHSPRRLPRVLTPKIPICHVFTMS